MKQIKAFKTQDGQIFVSKEEAQNHEDELKLEQRIDSVVQKHGWYGMSKSDVVDLILENADELGIKL